ncbi:MAG TPA: FAD-dependent oxidoreductase [Devosiaceae bacterium]|nr:FAD-dependent oxidoreductase [Devosiaceae bacterium]
MPDGANSDTDAARRTVYLAGAGIAGLTLALELAKRGFAVVVLEREPRPSPLGAGLQLSPNARLILNRLGLRDALAATAFEPLALDVYPFARTTPLASLAFGETVSRRYRAPYTVIHRAGLNEVLLAAARRSSNIEILWSIRRVDLVRHARGISMGIELPDRRALNVRPYAYVGADGVWSKTRIDLLDGPDAKFSGYVAWRALIAEAQLAGLVPLDRTCLFWGPGFHAVTYPLPAEARLNVALFTRLSARHAFALDPPTRPRIDKWYLRRSKVFGELMKIMGDKWTFWPISTVKTKRWHDGPVGLIGDAAHAMLPFQAQGAAMAIEDAAVLASELAATDTPESAFAAFEARRRKRVERVRALSQRNGRVFHLSWPFSQARNLAVINRAADAHLAELDWLYGFDAAAGEG